MNPKRRVQRKPAGESEQGRRIALLSLLREWRRGKETPEGFKRQAPDPGPPLPLKFTCKNCGHPAAPDASRCGECGHVF